MRKIFFVAPIDNSRNGGIASWAKSYMNNYTNFNYELVPVNIPALRNDREGLIWRLIAGIRQIYGLMKNIKLSLKDDRNVSLAHVTTSGSLGSLRDLIIGKYLHKKRIKCILHCHYGCVTDDVLSKGLVGILVRKAMGEYDQVWVLDSTSYHTLRNINSFREKVYLTPNSIDVIDTIDLKPKDYSRVAFIGNLIPTKGIFELIDACINTGVRLDLIGPGQDDILVQIKNRVGDRLNKQIYVHGRISNQEAVNFMREVDIVALPTYFQSEAFPISILEAMSLTKMVISCPRAAIPDMLTALDGKACGILVEPRSSTSISEAIQWCRDNSLNADIMCQNAYEKVYKCYRKELVFDIYTDNYNKLFIK